MIYWLYIFFVFFFSVFSFLVFHFHFSPLFIAFLYLLTFFIDWFLLTVAWHLCNSCSKLKTDTCKCIVLRIFFDRHFNVLLVLSVQFLSFWYYFFFGILFGFCPWLVSSQCCMTPIQCISFISHVSKCVFYVVFFFLIIIIGHSLKFNEVFLFVSFSPWFVYFHTVAWSLFNTLIFLQIPCMIFVWLNPTYIRVSIYYPSLSSKHVWHHSMMIYYGHFVQTIFFSNCLFVYPA